ncbi:hypothetical protein SAMN02745823_01823 [Sporobacter termitidis DSM 10068]|uniref:DUF2325 domain-containing protein n=1 Tax=Sporobacter termitidis DSM 10068 TaxID=1123282 RepID=A0A1M5XHE9_9FIRM|nr:DUF2325 domain-containing protein [Sporobacter termitidis]SHH99257.1 hypothetical protein SAMN02745823_01823 [Sporobacter termitidis DSM 10068]
MSLIIVGGHACMHCRYRELCQKRGHTVKVYTQMTPQLSKHIGSADGIIIFTSTVSHTMVETAVSAAKRKGIRVLRSHSSSASSLSELLNNIENAG